MQLCAHACGARGMLALILAGRENYPDVLLLLGKTVNMCIYIYIHISKARDVKGQRKLVFSFHLVGIGFWTPRTPPDETCLQRTAGGSHGCWADRFPTGSKDLSTESLSLSARPLVEVSLATAAIWAEQMREQQKYLAKRKTM